MKYRFVLFLCILCLLVAGPVSADLKKIDTGATVFLGETDLDLSSALDGKRQIAWWPAGNTTDSPPSIILNFTEADAFHYNISPALFANYTGTWYTYYPKPRTPAFVIAKPYFNLTVWDLDHMKDVTGASVQKSTRITYRITTNLYTVYSKVQRPDYNPFDTFVTVTLTGPTGKPINSIYTASSGTPGSMLYSVEESPLIKTSPYYWKDGEKWNRSSKGYDGTVLYPLGTYTFAATQNLNNMQMYYGASDSIIASGPKTVTFVADEAPLPTVTMPVQVTGQETPAVTAAAVTGTQPQKTASPTQTGKTTWTSTPFPPQVTLLALAIVSALFLNRMKKAR